MVVGVSVVASRSGLRWFDGGPNGIACRDAFAAFGCGGDIAIGAMAAGASAEEAVEIANIHHVECGLGVDVFKLR